VGKRKGGGDVRAGGTGLGGGSLCLNPKGRSFPGPLAKSGPTQEAASTRIQPGWVRVVTMFSLIGVLAAGLRPEGKKTLSARLPLRLALISNAVRDSSGLRMEVGFVF